MMMRQTVFPAFLALFLSFAAEALAQGRDRQVQWFPPEAFNPPGALNPKGKDKRETLPQNKKYILFYVAPPAEARPPVEFMYLDVIQASRGDWAFIRMNFDRENFLQKSWGLKNSPACIGCDIYGNDFTQTTLMSVDSLRALLSKVPESVRQFEAKLKSDYARTAETLKVDETRAVKGLADILLLGKTGYREVNESLAKLTEISDRAFIQCEVAESVDPETGIDYLEDLVKAFRATPPGVRAEIRICRIERLRDNVGAALQRLQKILKYDPQMLQNEIRAAVALLEEILKEGQSRLEAALRDERNAARTTLRKLAKDYTGTDLGRKAAEEARKLD